MSTVKGKTVKFSEKTQEAILKSKAYSMPNKLDMVGAAGFEPTITGSKPDALPLGYAPI